MKTKIKKIIVCLLAAITLFGTSACGETVNPSDGNSFIDGVQRYFTPVVKVSKSGLATWSDLEGAEKYVYRINDGEEIETTNKSVQLDLYDKLVVKCVGNGSTRNDSRWSDSVQYIPAHSYAIGASGERINTVNIYKADGTIVLDTINGTKPYGDVVVAGEEYIVEFDITVGPYHNALLLAGVENAVIADLVWSDSNYSSREGEQSDSSDAFYEVLYDTRYNTSPDYCTIHRSAWSYTGAYFKDEDGKNGLSTYGWFLKDTPAANDDGVYDTSADGFWTVEPNWCSSLYGAHFLSTKKHTKMQMEAGYKYVRFRIKYNELRKLSASVVSAASQYDTANGKIGFNLFAMLHQSERCVFFNSDDAVEQVDRDYSYATDDEGEIASDVSVYDAQTGTAVFANGSTGNVLQTGKKYVLEFDVSGSKTGRVCFTGIENALISDVTWSDKRYGERAGESAVADTLCVLELDKSSHHLAKDEPLFHRLWKTSDGYTGNFGSVSCTLNGNGEVDTANSSNRSKDNNRCLEFALKIWLASGKTNKQTNKQYFRMTVEWRSFDLIEVGHAIENESNPRYGELAGSFFNAFVYSPAGGRYLYLTAYSA